MEAMEMIAREAAEKPENLKNAPLKTPVRRLDEATAARKPDINYFQRPE
jgi:glycine dehydrogenase subunit 2